MHECVVRHVKSIECGGGGNWRTMKSDHVQVTSSRRGQISLEHQRPVAGV